MPSKTNTTAALANARRGDAVAAGRLVQSIYDQLRALAEAYLRNERRDHTLEPAALVHEAYLRLIDQAETDWNDRSHFLALSAEMMRRVLVDHARRRLAVKRGGERQRVTLSGIAEPAGSQNIEVLALEDALGRLHALDPRQAKIVELRFYGGLTNKEVASQLGLSESTVEKQWRFTKAWLLRELAASPESE